MRLARFTADGRSRFGVVVGDDVVPVDARPPSFEALVADPSRGVAGLEDPRWPMAEVRWLPPFTSRAKNFALVSLPRPSYPRLAVRPFFEPLLVTACDEESP